MTERYVVPVSKNMREYLKTFRSMSREDQREHLLDVASFCSDGAPVSLARKIEIYLEGENVQE